MWPWGSGGLKSLQALFNNEALEEIKVAVCVSSLCGCRCFSGSAHLDKYYSSSGGRGGTFLTLTGHRSRNVKHDWESTQEAGESRTAADVPIRVARRAFHTTAHGWHRRLRPLLLDEAARNLENKQQLRAAITTRQGHCNTVVPTAAENRPTLHFTPSQSNRETRRIKRWITFKTRILLMYKGQNISSYCCQPMWQRLMKMHLHEIH